MAELILGSGGVLVGVEQSIEVVGVPGCCDDRSGGGDELGMRRSGRRHAFLVELPATLDRRLVATQHGEGPGQQATQLSGEVALAGRRIAEVGNHRTQQASDSCLESGIVVVAEEPSETAQADEQRLPDGELTLFGEALGEAEELRSRQAAGGHRGPGVIDEVVALQGVEVRRAPLPTSAPAAPSNTPRDRSRDRRR